jgi:3-oxoadipate enol-lactonase
MTGIAIETAYVPGHPRLAYDHAGDGPPVVFLHGIGGNRTNWHAQLLALAPDFMGVAWDARGYGLSDDYDGALAFEDFADDLTRLLDHLGAETAHLVGLSMGARILMEFHAHHAARMASLVLCDCFPSFDASMTAEKRAEFLRLRQKPLLDGKTFADLAPALVRSLISPTAGPQATEALTESVLGLRKESYLKTLAATQNYDRAAELEKIAVPTLLIFGADDRLTPPSIGRAMAERIAGAELVVINGAGHLVNLEKPDLFNETLRRFLLPMGQVG